MKTDKAKDYLESYESKIRADKTLKDHEHDLRLMLMHHLFEEYYERKEETQRMQEETKRMQEEAKRKEIIWQKQEIIWHKQRNYLIAGLVLAALATIEAYMGLIF